MHHGPGGPRARQAFNGSRQDGRRGSRHDAERRPAARATLRRVRPDRQRQDDSGCPVPPRRAPPAGTVPARHPRRAPDRGQGEHGHVHMEPGPPQDPRCDSGHPGAQTPTIRDRRRDIPRRTGHGRRHGDPAVVPDPGARGHGAQRAEDDQTRILPSSRAHEATVQARRHRLDDRPQDVRHAGPGQSDPDPVVRPVPRGTRGDDAYHLGTVEQKDP